MHNFVTLLDASRSQRSESTDCQKFRVARHMVAHHVPRGFTTGGTIPAGCCVWLGFTRTTSRILIGDYQAFGPARYTPEFCDSELVLTSLLVKCGFTWRRLFRVSLALVLGRLLASLGSLSSFLVALESTSDKSFYFCLHSESFESRKAFNAVSSFTVV